MDYGDKAKPYSIPKNTFGILLADIHKTIHREFGGGWTTYHSPKNPINGSWVGPNGRIIHDRNILFMIWTEDVNHARRFFKYYKTVLQKKFKQNLVEIVEETIDII